MTKEEQIAFVRELADAVTVSIVTNIANGKVPETWDGHELRQLLADRFAQSAGISDSMKNKRRARRRDYENTVIVNNL